MNRQTVNSLNEKPSTYRIELENALCASNGHFRSHQKADSQQTVVDKFVFFQKAADDGFFRIVALVVSQDVQADFRRRFMRITVDTRGNAWKRDGDALFFSGAFEAVDVA